MIKNIKTCRKTNQVKKSGFVLDALTFPSQTLIIKSYYFLQENENNLTTNIELTKFSITCSICLRKLGKPLKGIPCNRCKPLFTEEVVS